jgi:multiple sugar transport system permease protein
MSFSMRARTSGSGRTRQERLALRLLLPVLGTVVLAAAIPFILAGLRSLTAEDGTFVGVSNFSKALADPELAGAVWATAIYAVIVLPIEVLGGLGLALLVQRTIKSTGLRAMIYVLATIPIVIPMIAVGVVFRLIYVADYGLLNVLLGATGKSQIFWLSSPPLAILSVASVDIWQWTPFVYLVLFAGFQTVPPESVEAAQLDGAGSWAQFRFVELPYLRPLLLLVLFFRLADVVWVFDHVYVLTGGGPGTTTQFLSLYLYKIAFRFDQLGPASALAVIIMVVMMIFYLLMSRYLRLEKS